MYIDHTNKLSSVTVVQAIAICLTKAQLHVLVTVDHGRRRDPGLGIGYAR